MIRKMKLAYSLTGMLAAIVVAAGPIARWIHNFQFGSGLQESGIMTREEWFFWTSFTEKYRGREHQAYLTDEEVDKILGFMKAGSPRPNVGPDNTSISVHFGSMAALLRTAQMTQAQKDRALPVIRTVFNGPDTSEHAVKLFAIDFMRWSKDPRFIPDALPYINDRNPDVRFITQKYLEAVGYHA